MRAIILAALALGGCNNSPQMWSRDEITDIADDVAEDRSSAIRRETADLNDRVEELERKLEQQERYATAISKDVTSISNQVVHNAGVQNDNALKDMTRRGACGYTSAIGPGGGTIWTPNRCTKKDLAP